MQPTGWSQPVRGFLHLLQQGASDHSNIPSRICYNNAWSITAHPRSLRWSIAVTIHWGAEWCTTAVRTCMGRCETQNTHKKPQQYCKQHIGR